MALTVTIHPTGTVGEDANGDDIDIPGTPYELEVDSIYPRTSEEPGDTNRDLVITGMTTSSWGDSRVPSGARIVIPVITRSRFVSPGSSDVLG